jgi:hypothetical protein
LRTKALENQEELQGRYGGGGGGGNHPSVPFLRRQDRLKKMREENVCGLAAVSKSKNSSSSPVPVYLNVYDLTPLNGYFYWIGVGIYHSGIEAHGAEYAFGAHDYPTSGVFEVEPRHCPGFTFRSSLLLGTTDLSPLEFRSFIEKCADEYCGDTYHLIARNCNHFTDDLCQRLMGKPIPGWVNRLARIGYMCNCLLPEGLQVSGTDDHTHTPDEFQHVRAETGHDFEEPGGKEMVESGSDQECALITLPNAHTQALLRDSFKEFVAKPHQNDEHY